MMSVVRRLLGAITLLSVLLVACTQPIETPKEQPPQQQIANPAAKYCTEQGGQYEIVTADDGSQSGTCMLADGTVCNGWDYFRGDCP